MRAQQEPTPYEVKCQSCGVSFPVGTRSCIHCGQRIGRPPRRVQIGALPGSPPTVPEEVGEEESGRSGLMSPVAILWIALLVGGAVYRACGG